MTFFKKKIFCGPKKKEQHPFNPFNNFIVAVYVQEQTRKNMTNATSLTSAIELLPCGWVGPCAVSGAGGAMEAEEGQHKNVLVPFSCLCGRRQTGAAQALRCQAEGGCPRVQAQKDYETAS